MEAARARGNRDNPRTPLSLELSSVQFIVNKIETEYTRATASESTHELAKYDPNVDEEYDDCYDPLLGAPRGRVWSRFAVNLGVALSRCIPSVTIGNFGVFAVAAGFFAPKMISYLLLYPFCRLVFGTLYPAYASYKAVRTKNLKEYVKWMMYWIVFALFTCTETFTDVFLSWFPFYYEVKIVLVLWLLSPATKGSSILYRKFVHPALCRREQEIDEYIAKAKDQGYHTVLNLGTKGVNYATTVIMQTAIKGGGGLVQQIRKSYSLSDLSECEPREERSADEADDVLTEPRLIRRTVAKSGYNTRRSASESNSRGAIYFPEVDVDVRAARSRGDEPDFGHIKSSEDISSGYSSADNSASLTRTASLSAASRAKARTRTTVTTIKRPQAAEDEVIIEELHDDDTFDYANMPPLMNLPQNLYLSDSDPPFIYQLVGDQVRIIQVLGSNNSSFNNETNNPDRWDQNEAFQDASTTINDVEKDNKESTAAKTTNHNLTEIASEEKVSEEKIIEETKKNEEKEKNNILIYAKQNDNNLDNIEIPVVVEEIEFDNKEVSEIPIKSESIITNQETTENTQSADIETSKVEAKVVDEPSKVEVKVVDETLECTSLDTSINENESEDSDDEASFGTPEGSPKNKRKSPKGKYGKEKAPQPPAPGDKTETRISSKDTFDATYGKVKTASQGSLVDIGNKLPNTTFRETGTHKSLQVVNPIAEKKRRNKSKSPGRIPKSSSSGLGKLLQLPGKLAFWNRNDDKHKDNISTSSGDHSRRSSTFDKTLDEFSSCNDLHEASNDLIKEITDDQLSFQDAEFVDSEVISHDIIEKSDELQKLIEAKIESHPEYKLVSLHEELPTTSKSTDV